MRFQPPRHYRTKRNTVCFHVSRNTFSLLLGLHPQYSTKVPSGGICSLQPIRHKRSTENENKKETLRPPPLHYPYTLNERTEPRDLLPFIRSTTLPSGLQPRGHSPARAACKDEGSHVSNSEAQDRNTATSRYQT